MISGAGELKVRDYTPVTGLGVFKPIAVNPTNKEYTEITGQEMPYPLTYDPYDTTVGDKTVSARPVSILGYNPEMELYEFISFTLINEEVSTKAGDKFKFVNKVGQISYFAKDSSEIANNPSVAQWYNTEDMTKLRIGEESFYTFLQRLIKYDARSEGAQFKTDIHNIGADFDTLYKGDTTGLRKLLEWAKAEDHSIGVLYTVREKEKDGTIYDIQYIENNPNLFFITKRDDSGKHSVSKGAIKRVQKYVEDREEAGLVGIKNYYTLELMKYKREACENYEEAPKSEVTPSPSSGSTTGTSGW